MVANMARFGLRAEKEANEEIRTDLGRMQKKASELMIAMELTETKMNFSQSEIDNWIALYEALRDFKSLDVRVYPTAVVKQPYTENNIYDKSK